MDFIWEKDAANNRPMPDGLPTPEQSAYQAMCRLYARFRAGNIDKEHAAEEKAKIKSELKKEIEMANFEDDLAFMRERMLRLTETANIAARKNPTKENCIALCDVLDGIKTNDCIRPANYTEHGANCPVCGKFFAREHCERKPTFCENCGARLGWKAGE